MTSTVSPPSVVPRTTEELLPYGLALAAAYYFAFGRHGVRPSPSRSPLFGIGGALAVVYAARSHAAAQQLAPLLVAHVVLSYYPDRHMLSAGAAVLAYMIAHSG